MSDILSWNIFEISSDESSLNGVMLRGRIRKFGIENDVNVLVENTEDVDNGVRFATLSKSDTLSISQYISTIISDAHITLILEDVQNPVLSKLKVNQEDRYTL